MNKIQKFNGNNVFPGFALRSVLHEKVDIKSIAWSPDGNMLAVGTDAPDIHCWDVHTGKVVHTLSGHTGAVDCIVWSPDGKILASGSADSTVCLWDTSTMLLLGKLEGHSGRVWSMAWSPDGSMLASGSEDQSICIWNIRLKKVRGVLDGINECVNSVAWLPDRNILVAGYGTQPSDVNSICLWDMNTKKSLLQLAEHDNWVNCVAWLPDQEILASGSGDNTIRLWTPFAREKQCIKSLELHTGTVHAVAFSCDGRLLASKSLDGSVFLWRTDSWESIVRLDETTTNYVGPARLAFHPHLPVLATLGEKDKIIRLWDLDVDTLLKNAPLTSSVHYTTAKIALVGDSTVGKSGLGYRVVEDRFQVTESTHGQKFWVVDKLGITRSDGTQCEAVLWDFAGQPNFRPIHSLFLDDVDLALILYDPARAETLKGVDYWLKQLAYKGRQCRSILVAARTDVSKLDTPLTELEVFCQERAISGGFVITSAKTGEGVEVLLDQIRQHIDWDARPATVTSETFKRIKDYVLKMKADGQRTYILVSFAQLRALLEATDPDWQFSDAEVQTAVRHLQNHGYVTILRRSSEEQRILLLPDLLINLAASFMLKAQSNEKGLGALEESRALHNDYHFPEVEDVSEKERDVLLNAVTELFLDRNICFRESVDNQTFLIFPSLIVERPPRLTEEADLIDDITYVVTGLVENVYPALVVLLGYSPSFQRMNQWRKQAQYETARGEICGFKLANDDPGELELVLYYGRNTPEFVRSRFQGLFEEILSTRQVSVRKYAPVICPKCGRAQERRTVIGLLQEGKKFLFCAVDGKKIMLSKVAERVVLSQENHATVVRERVVVSMRTTYETALVSVKGFLRDRGDTTQRTCFLSYAWGDPVQERWVQTLADDLRNANIDVILDQWNNAAIGSSVSRFISRIEQSNFVLVIGTPTYRLKYENKLSQYGSVVAAEVDLINVRMTGTEAQKASVMPLLLAGEERTSFPPLMHRRVYSDFTREEYYFFSLFDLVLTLHQIPFDDPIVRDLREKLRDEAMRLRWSVRQ